MRTRVDESQSKKFLFGRIEFELLDSRAVAVKKAGESLSGLIEL